MLRALPKTVRIAGLIASAVLAAPALAAPGTLGPLLLPPGHRSTEASVAIDPENARDVLVVARDEDAGGLVGLREWRSTDAGMSFWGRTLIDRRLDGRPADASDPVAQFDHRGRATPAFLALRYGRSWWESRIMLGDRTVARIRHGLPVPSLQEGFGNRRWFDKPWARIDPRRGTAYVVWTERSATRAGPVEKVALTRADPGRPFDRVRILGDGSGAQPVIGAGSTVVVVWYQQPNLSLRARILSSRSTDRGRTWSRPAIVATGVGARGDPPFPTVVRSGSGFVACWQQYPAWPRERIACSRSADGTTWQRSRVVAQPRRAGDAAQPALAAGPDGQLWLAFYRFAYRSTAVELWSSTASTTTWRFRAVLMRRPVGRAGFWFLGDYQGLAAGGDQVIAAFVMPTRTRAYRQVVQVARFAAATP